MLDFSCYRVAYRLKSSMSYAYLMTLCLHIIVLAMVKGELTTQNYDYFAPESNDYFFYRRVMLDLMESATLISGMRLRDAKRVSIWSDGGPKHFKIKQLIAFVSVEVKTRFRFSSVCWCYFASHHGKSICDSHAAVVKRRFWRTAIHGPSEDAAHVNERVKNTTAKSLNYFGRETESFEVKGFVDGVKAMHHFECVDDLDAKRALPDDDASKLKFNILSRVYTETLDGDAADDSHIQVVTFDYNPSSIGPPRHWTCPSR